jgi:hypothetical protein
MPVGDVDSNLERAIQLQEEAVSILNLNAWAGDALHRARALHNLAKYYLERRTGIRSHASSHSYFIPSQVLYCCL